MSGIDASVSGGLANTASGEYASVSGGESNTASVWAASVSGGENNQANDVGASVSGGDSNKAQSQEASISGGALITLKQQHVCGLASRAQSTLPDGPYVHGWVGRSGCAVDGRTSRHSSRAPSTTSSATASPAGGAVCAWGRMAEVYVTANAGRR